MGTLTQTEIETEVRESLGGRTDLNSRLYIIGNLAQDAITRGHLWSELEDVDTSVSTVASQTYVLPPANTRAIISVTLQDGTNSRKLIYVPPRRWDLLIPRPASYTEMRPEFYTYSGERLYLHHVPDDAYTLQIRRIKNFTAFTNGGSSASDLDNKDEIIIAFMVAYCKRSIGEEDDGWKWENQARSLLKKAIAEDRRRPDFAIQAQYGSAYANDYWLDPFIRSTR